MINSIRQKAIVRKGGRIEVLSPELTIGVMVEIIILIEPPSLDMKKEPCLQSSTDNNQLDKIKWPPYFFEKTAGCLADDPIERAPQGDYEIRETLK